MRTTLFFIFLIVVLTASAKAESDDLEILELEAPGCGQGGSNYLGEVISYDPLDILPDLTMEPIAAINALPKAVTRASAQNPKMDINCIDSFEREANDQK